MIDLQGTARRYGPRWALAGVTLHLPAATAVMLAGKNGAGKSTLLRILATAIRPDRGSCAGTLPRNRSAAFRAEATLDIRAAVRTKGHNSSREVLGTQQM